MSAYSVRVHMRPRTRSARRHALVRAVLIIGLAGVFAVLLGG